MSKQLKARNLQLTLNEVDRFADLLQYVKSLKSFQYGIASQEEAPTTGHKHIHFYIQFKKAQSVCREKLQGAHIEVCRGSAQQNIEYVKKDGDIIFEEGSPIFKGGATISDIKKMKKEDRENLPGCYFNIVQKVNQEEAKHIDPDSYFKEIEVYWYWGESGAGKTRAALKKIKEIGGTFNEVKFDGNFWHGVSEEGTIALYDDFRDTHMRPSELINFMDYNRHVMNIKGGTIRNNYKYILITSVQDPEKIYSKMEDMEPRKQWLRRIKLITHFEVEG